jgi:hypothetical protein
MMQAIGRVERALARAERLVRQLAEEKARARDAQLAGLDDEADDDPAVDIDPFCREKAVAALRSLDALIGDLQKARSDA